MEEGTFASVEGFLHAIKLPYSDEGRAQVACLATKAAKSRGRAIGRAGLPRHVHWKALALPFRSLEQRALVAAAIRVKFEQNPEAREALLATGTRRIVHDAGRPESPSTSLPCEVFVHVLTDPRGDMAR